MCRHSSSIRAWVGKAKEQIGSCWREIIAVNSCVLLRVPSSTLSELGSDTYSQSNLLIMIGNICTITEITGPWSAKEDNRWPDLSFGLCKICQYILCISGGNNIMKSFFEILPPCIEVSYDNEEHLSPNLPPNSKYSVFWASALINIDPILYVLVCFYPKVCSQRGNSEIAQRPCSV